MQLMKEPWICSQNALFPGKEDVLRGPVTLIHHMTAVQRGETFEFLGTRTLRVLYGEHLERLQQGQRSGDLPLTGLWVLL